MTYFDGDLAKRKRKTGLGFAAVETLSGSQWPVTTKLYFLIVLQVHTGRQGTLLPTGPELHRLQWATSLVAVVEKESMEGHRAGSRCPFRL